MSEGNLRENTFYLILYIDCYHVECTRYDSKTNLFIFELHCQYYSETYLQMIFSGWCSHGATNGKDEKHSNAAHTPVCIVHMDSLRHWDLHLLSEL